MGRKFDAIIGKNEIARVLRGIERGEYASMSEIPLRALRFNLREIEIYTGESNQPSIMDIIETKEYDL